MCQEKLDVQMTFPQADAATFDADAFSLAVSSDLGVDPTQVQNVEVRGI